MTRLHGRRAPQTRELVGLGLVVAGEVILAGGWRPLADYYFPVVWYGYILTLDGALQRLGRPSLIGRSPLLFALMLPLSAAIWWLFELFDVAVHSWRYVGTGAISTGVYLVLATVSFSTVVPAVWETALCITQLGGRLQTWRELMPATTQSQERAGDNREAWIRLIMPLSLAVSVVSFILPVIWPRYFFGLIWGSMFLLLDPVNHWLGRPSILAQVLRRQWNAVVCFALAALVCGFFWESWNYWAAVKWVYNVPYVSQWHLFEMPVPGYAGYLPFGLELYAMAVFVLWPFRRFLGPHVDELFMAGYGEPDEERRITGRQIVASA